MEIGELATGGGASPDEGQDEPESSTERFRVRIMALEFKSDHGPMNDMLEDWTKDGNDLPEPEWQRRPLVRVPVSHTRKQKISAEATFKVVEATNGAKNGTAVGVHRRRALSFRSSGSTSLGPGDEKKIKVVARKRLPNTIGRIRGLVRWRVKAGGKRYRAGASGPHEIYVTYGDPIDEGQVEDGVTIRRMRKSVQWLGAAWRRGRREPADLIEAVFSKFDGYVLGFEHLSPHQRRFLSRHPAVRDRLETAGFATYMKDDQGGAWPLAQFYRFGAECQAIVRLTKAIAHQVGLPGTLEQKYVSSEPDDPYKTRILDDPYVDPDGPVPGYDYALVDGPVSVGQEYGAADGVGFNRYEAFLKYTSPTHEVTWFGGGIGRVEMDESDLVKVFWGLAAFEAGGPDPDNPGYEKSKIVRVWRY